MHRGMRAKAHSLPLRVSPCILESRPPASLPARIPLPPILSTPKLGLLRQGSGCFSEALWLALFQVSMKESGRQDPMIWDPWGITDCIPLHGSETGPHCGAAWLPLPPPSNRWRQPGATNWYWCHLTSCLPVVVSTCLAWKTWAFHITFILGFYCHLLTEGFYFCRFLMLQDTDIEPQESANCWAENSSWIQWGLVLISFCNLILFWEIQRSMNHTQEIWMQTTTWPECCVIFGKVLNFSDPFYAIHLPNGNINLCHVYLARFLENSNKVIYMKKHFEKCKVLSKDKILPYTRFCSNIAIRA